MWWTVILVLHMVVIVDHTPDITMVFELTVISKAILPHLTKLFDFPKVITAQQQ